MKIKAYAKVNLTLEIVGQSEGYHLLDSLVASVDIFDLIHFKKRKDKRSLVIFKGIGSENIPPNNNALKAAEAFSERFSVPGADITVYRNIPVGAGLGSSSADISGVLNGMAKLYGVDDKAGIEKLAEELGSDTRYMLQGGFARMQGRGEKITPLDFHGKLHFLLLCPSTGVSAGACYKEFDQAGGKIAPSGQTQSCIEMLMKNDLHGVGERLMNDLYAPAARLNGEVQKAYEEALSFSPLGAVMTGSGSCVLALFETRELCEWAKSRYKGKCKAYVAETVVEKKKFWRNPFAVAKGEME